MMGGDGDGDSLGIFSGAFIHESPFDSQHVTIVNIGEKKLMQTDNDVITMRKNCQEKKFSKTTLTYDRLDSESVQTSKEMKCFENVTTTTKKRSFKTQNR